MTRSMISAVCLLPLALLPLACAADGEQQSQDKATGVAEPGAPTGLTTGASFTTTNRGKVDLLLDDDGGLIVSIVEPGMSSEALAAYQSGKSDFVDLYVGLTGNTEIPADVAAMNEILLERRSQAGAGAASQADPAVEQVTPAEAIAPTASPGQKSVATANLRTNTLGASAGGPARSPESLVPRTLTTAQFVTGYCGASDWSYAFCWPNVTGTGSYGQYCFYMKTAAYAVAGSITHRIDRHLFGSWRPQLQNNVPQGYLSVLERYANGLQDNMRGGVWDATGDVYHAAVYGLR